MSRFAKAAAVTVAAGAALAGTAGSAAADAGAQGAAIGSPGVISGNVVQAPVNIPINLCGNTVDVIGVLNPTFGNTCVNGGDDNRKQHGKKQNGKKSGHGQHKGAR